MNQIIDINNKPCTIYLHIETSQKCKFRITACDVQPHSYYVYRTIEVADKRTIFLSFPVAPKQIRLSVECLGDKVNSRFKINPEVKDLRKYNIWIDEETENFLDLAVPFSQVCGFEIPTRQGKVYSSEDKTFNIKYVPQIIDYMTGKSMSTPARIGHNTGLIEVNAGKFIKYTIPMRMMILLHEFSHKWKNPKINLPISDEVGADINALYIYLGLGFSKVDAIYVYANVFLSAQGKGNQERMRKIMDYIARFENQEFAKRIE